MKLELLSSKGTVAGVFNGPGVPDDAQNGEYIIEHGGRYYTYDDSNDDTVWYKERKMIGVRHDQRLEQNRLTGDEATDSLYGREIG